jgi:hypothetical protein
MKWTIRRPFSLYLAPSEPTLSADAEEGGTDTGRLFTIPFKPTVSLPSLKKNLNMLNESPYEHAPMAITTHRPPPYVLILRFLDIQLDRHPSMNNEHCMVQDFWRQWMLWNQRRLKSQVTQYWRARIQTLQRDLQQLVPSLVSDWMGDDKYLERVETCLQQLEHARHHFVRLSDMICHLCLSYLIFIILTLCMFSNLISFL